MAKDNPTFKPRARLILQLGDQLIKNESIAILELVKNSYDADASYVKVSMKDMDSRVFGLISIVDDGEGMDKSIIKNVWLELGNDNKKKLVDANKRTKRFKRLPIGEKGIGRFGLHKLGDNITITSKKAGKKEVFFSINFREFEEKAYLNDIPVIIQERDPEIFTNNRTGTLIEITNLHNEWDRNSVRKVYRSLLNLNSPFNKKDAFKVHFEIDKTGWISDLLKFDKIKDYSLYYFKVTMKGSKIIDFTYQFKPWVTLDKVKGRTVKINDPIIKEDLTLMHFIEIIDDKTKKIKRVLAPLILDEKKIGPVVFEGYIFTLSAQLLSHALQTGKDDLRNYLNDNGGISIYRDGLRINEYGDQGNDWLNLDIRRVNTPGEKISNNLILATIDLTREHSKGLIEKTNREGFIDNDHFRNFKDSINYVTDKIEDLRIDDKEAINEEYSNSKVSEPVIEELENLRFTVKNQVQDELVKNKLLKNLDLVEKEYNRVNEILLASAGAGLSLSIVLHEIEKITIELNTVVKKELASTKLLKLSEHLADLIKGYGDIIRQSKYGKDDLKSLLKGALFNIEYRLENHNIKIIDNTKHYNGETKINCSKRLILGSILNLLDNSIYWLDRKQNQIRDNKFKKVIFTSIVETESSIKLIIADNGTGFTISPSNSIKPFITKKSGGMGLGLHITNEIMKAHKGFLEFPDPNEYNIPIEFKDGAIVVYFGETDHPIPAQTDHLNCWRTDAANAVEACTKIVI